MVQRTSLSRRWQNETWLREQALAASRSAIVVTDPNEPDNPIVYANPAFERITGYFAEEVLGKNCRFLQGEDRDQPALGELRAAIREGRECQVVLRNYKKDGTLFWNELSISPVHDEKGDLANFVGVLSDVTERKQTEEALQYQLDLTRTITNNAADSLFLWDAQGRVTFMNPAAEQTFGWKREEFLGEVLHDKMHHHHPDGRPYPISECPLVKIFESGQTLRDHEDLFFRRDGSPIHVACSHAPIVVDGKITGAALVVRDITERRQAEEAGARLAAIIESSDDAIIGKTLDGIITNWNRGAQKIYGYSAEEIVGKPINILVPPERPDEIPKILDRIRRGEAVEHYETVRMTKDGRHLNISLTVSPIKDAIGNIIGASTIARDVTERKRVEEAQRFLAEAGASLSSSLDYRATLASVARLAVPHLADWCVVDILEEDGSLDRLAVAHQDPEKVALAQELQELYPPDAETQRGVPQVLRTGRSELVPEIPESFLDEAVRDAEYREILGELGLKSYMIVPLIARGRALGTISLVSAESGRRYGQAELELAEELARRAALAVDNARLYKGRSQVVRALQEGLLPSRLPEVPGVAVGLRYLSAGEVDVGGDFYDLFETSMADQDGSSEPPSSSSWGVVIGDVSGKGAEAAAVLALARYTIRALATRESHPSAVLTGLNEAMLRQRHEHDDYKFCTVTYVRLETNDTNPQHGVKVTVCRGGHSAPFLLKADGSIYKIGQPGRAIGVFDDVNLTEQEVRLAPGDALVLYTDGVVEARSPEGIFFGEERLMNLLRFSVALDASTIASHIEGAVLNFQEQAPRDDIAVLVLRVSD